MGKYSNYLNKGIERNHEDDLSSIVKIDRWIFVLLLIGIGVTPLILGASFTDVVSPLISERSTLSSGSKAEIFTNFKHTFLLVITLITSLLFLYKYYILGDQIKKTTINWFLIIFIASLLISTLLAPYKTIAIFGQFNRNDGALAYISYSILLFIGMNITYPKRALHYILFSLYPFILINIVIITFNFTGHDLLSYERVMNFITATLPDNASVDAGSSLVGTLNQWNYMAGMGGILVTLLLAGSMLAKNMIIKVSHLIFALISFAITLMALSTSGFFTISLIMILLIALVFRLPNKRMATLSLVIFILAAGGILHTLASENPRVWDESVGLISSTNPYREEVQAQQAAPSTYQTSLDLSFLVPSVSAAETFTLPELPARDIAPGSGRLYIWEKSLDMVTERPIFGYGMDTFMYHFPHTDIGMRSGLRTENVTVDKPHNIFIAVLFGTGIVGFIGFLGLVSIPVLLMLKYGYLKIPNQTTQEYVAILGLGWLAFLIQGLVNDSLPGTSGPLFIIGGMMLGLMYQELRDKDINDQTSELKLV